MVNNYYHGTGGGPKIWHELCEFDFGFARVSLRNMDLNFKADALSNNIDAP